MLPRRRNRSTDIKSFTRGQFLGAAAGAAGVGLLTGCEGWEVVLRTGSATTSAPDVIAHGRLIHTMDDASLTAESLMEWMFAHRSFLDYDIPVAPASDYTPGPYEPLMAIQSMVTRKDFDGRVWGPSQRITVAEAMRICTMGGAYASFEEDIKGSVTVGKLADFAVLAEDPHEVDPDGIKEIPVLRTVAGGRVTWEG